MPKYILKILLILLLFPGYGLAATYHIDPTYGSGGNGTTATTPFDSWSDLPGTMSTSDRVYFKCGTTFTATARLDVDWSGTSETNAVVGAYYLSGSTPVYGVNGDGRPIISGNNHAVPGQYSGLIHIQNNYQYITIKDLHFYRSGGAGVWMQGDYTEANSPDHVTVQNCYFERMYDNSVMANRCPYNYLIVEDCESFEHSYRSTTGSSSYSCAILTANSPYSNAIFRKNYVAHGWGEGLCAYRLRDAPASHSGHVLIEDNLVFNNRRVGVYFCATENNTARRNLSIGGGPTIAQSIGGQYTDGRYWDTCGIQVDQEYDDNEDITNSVNNNAVYDNVVIGAYRGFGIGHFTDYGSMTGNVFYNNTAIACRYNFTIWSTLSSLTLSGNEFKNNVSICPSDANCTDVQRQYSWMPSKTGLDIDYNSWNSQPTYWAGDNDVATDTNWPTLTGMQALTGIPADIIAKVMPHENASVVVGEPAVDLGETYDLGIAKTSVYESSPLNIDVDTVSRDTVGWHMGAVPFQSDAPVTEDKTYVGFATTSGVPATTPTYYVGYPGDRIYLRKWTSTEAGNAYSLRFYTGSSNSATALWAGVFKNNAGTMQCIGYKSLAAQTASSWNDEHVFDTFPYSKSFTSSTDLYLAVAVRPSTEYSFSIGRNYPGGTGRYTYVTSMTSGLPTSFSASSMSLAADHDLAIVFGYEEYSEIADETPPVLAVTTTATTTTETSYTIEGTVSDDVGVDRITWSCAESGYSGEANFYNPPSWSVTPSLVLGTNTIVVYAYDTSENVDGPEQVVITRENPAVPTDAKFKGSSTGGFQ